MPRRNRRERSEPTLASLSERVLGPASARLEGFETRTVVNSLKRYRCPYCHGSIEPGTHHIVAVPTGAADSRRHYHSGCWAKQVRTSSPERRAVRD